MADENLALEGERAQVVDTAAEQQPEEQHEPTASELAAELGWKPKDQWQGDPEAWKPAADFIKAGRDIQQSTSRELRALREQMERVAGVTSQIVTDKVAERDAYWQTQFNQAVEEGDTETARKLAENRPSAAAKGADPTVASWVSKNEWFNKDPLARARAEEISNKLAHLPVSEQLAQVERGIRKEFPEHFPAPAKTPPATQTGQSRTAQPSSRVKGFADMPAASQQAALDFERLNKVPKEDFARSYWAQEAKKGSRA